MDVNKPNPYSSPETETPYVDAAEPQRGLRWYHYALRRLPVSLLISLVTLLMLLLLSWLGAMFLRQLQH
jgi:hypothetical protein